jgi:hypothetical protein
MVIGNKSWVIVALMLISMGATAQTLRRQTNISRMGIPPGNYSGITRINDTLYAVVNDKEKTDGFHLFTVNINLKNGKIKHVSDKMVGSQTPASHDMEGICYRSSSNSLFISDETSQRILEYSLDGIPTGNELKIPEIYGIGQIQSNRGFEALTYNPSTGHFWTATESALKRDADSDPLLVHLQSFGDDLQPDGHFLYRLDPPRKNRTARTKFYAHGLPSLIAMDDGSIIVMERSLYSPSKLIGSFVEIKLYRITPQAFEAAGKDATKVVDKQLVTSFRTHIRIGKINYANYEGMCIGPKLNDWRSTIILINDSQNRMGNWLCRLKDYLKVIIL